MSEYQYYEFLAIDRSLTPAQIAAVRGYSSRATVTSTSFINEYHYGDFRGKPREFLGKYFDAMVYIANWGTRQFMFRVPRNLIDIKSIEPYCTEQMLTVIPAGEFYLFDICRQEEDGGDYLEGDGHMASLAGLRAEVMSGDLRPLYLAWLAALQAGEIPEADATPPIPAGMRKLSASQKTLAEFLEIDNVLIRMIAAESPGEPASSAVDLDAALARMPIAEKDQWLKELIQNDDPNAGLRLSLKLKAAVQPPQSSAGSDLKQSAGELFQKYKHYVRELDEQMRQVAAIKRKKAAAAAAAEREKQLDQVAKNIPGAWRNIEQMIGLRNAEGYKQAVEALIDLRDISKRPGNDADAFQRELANRLITHRAKSSFIKMAYKAGLSPS